MLWTSSNRKPDPEWFSQWQDTLTHITRGPESGRSHNGLHPLALGLSLGSLPSGMVLFSGWFPSSEQSKCKGFHDSNPHAIISRGKEIVLKRVDTLFFNIYIVSLFLSQLFWPWIYHRPIGLRLFYINQSQWQVEMLCHVWIKISRATLGSGGWGYFPSKSMIAIQWVKELLWKPS